MCVCAGPMSSGVEMSNENFAYEYEPFYTEQNFTGLGRRFTHPPARAQLAPQDVGWVLVAASKLHSISYSLYACLTLPSCVLFFAIGFSFRH